MEHSLVFFSDSCPNDENAKRLTFVFKFKCVFSINRSTNGCKKEESCKMCIGCGVKYLLTTLQSFHGHFQVRGQTYHVPTISKTVKYGEIARE